MARQEEEVGDHRRHHGAADDGGDEEAVLRLVDDAVAEPEERRDGAEGEPGRYQQHVVDALVAAVVEGLGGGEETRQLGHHLGQQQDQEHQRGAEQRGHRDERAGADEVERREHPEGQGAQAPHQHMVLADGAGKHHADQVGRQHRLGARPYRQPAHAEQEEEDELRLQLRRAVAEPAEEPWRQPGKQGEDRRRHHHEDQRAQGERREDERQRQDRPDVVDEACGQDGLAVSGAVQAQLEHHRVDHGHRGGGQGDSGEPAAAHGPAQQVVGGGGAAEEGSEEAHQADDHRLLPFRPEGGGVELGAGQEGEDDGAGAGEEGDPRRLGAEAREAEVRADRQLGDGADEDLGEGGRDAQRNGRESGDQGESKPERRQQPRVFHEGLLLST
jgi:hypothetical protein